MPKSRIIKEIAEGNVGLEKSLNRVYLLASDVGNTELMNWAEKELQGYSSEDELPDYRISKSFVVRFSGINGSFQIKQAALQPSFLKKESIDAISTVKVGECVRALEDYINNGQEIVRDQSIFAGEVYKLSHGLIRCTNITQILPANLFQEILANVKQRVIQELISLEKQYGCLDNLEIHNDSDPENIAFWSNVNEHIMKEAKERYMQGFYADAVERAVREVETKLREMFRVLKPDAKEPNKVGDIIGALLTANGAYQYCDNSTSDGKNFQNGFVKIVEGFFSAYRNPMAHNNKILTKQDAFELITLSSLIMNVLETSSSNAITSSL